MLDIQILNNTKAITSKDTLGIFPLGKKGDELKFKSLSGSDVTLYYGMTINDSDRRNIITCISYALNRIGYEQIEKIKNVPLRSIEDSGQISFTTFRIKASCISSKLYKTTREGRQVAKSLKKALHLLVDFNQINNAFTQIQNIAYKNGYITFDIANILINHIVNTRLPFRIGSTIIHTGFDYRLSFYVETHQYRFGYSEKKQWYPKQVYHLDKLLNGLRLEQAYTSQPARTIKQIEKAFNNLHLKNENFPKYIYDKDKKFFYNQYKKAADCNLF